MSGEEFFDAGLKEIMGDRYDDSDAPLEMPVLERKEAPKKSEPTAHREPAPKKRSEMDRLADMLKWTVICGGISMLRWWFQVNSLMAMEAAYPCIIGCALLAGYGVGKNVVK